MTSKQIHITPFGTYVTIGVTLLILTAVTVAAAQYDFGAWNLLIALMIAGAKASLVALIFMHLKYENKLFGLVFVAAILFLVAFMAFTMFDTQTRGLVNLESARPFEPRAAIYDSEGNPIPMEDRVVASHEEVVPAQEEEVPFELLHGYGPIKELVEVSGLDTVRAMQGRAIFDSKCGTCHKLDERYTGPPLRGVSVYRSPTFIMNQILDPVQNVSNHPDMKAMLATYYTVMTNQNVSQEQARTLLEYLRWAATQPPGTE